MYTVKFFDNSEFKGGTPDNSLWNEMPDKKITAIAYEHLNYSYTLSGFEKYNHIVKRGLFLSTNNSSVIEITIMGLYKNKVYQIVFDVLNQKIHKKICDSGKEYNEKSHSGWKDGVISSQLPTID